MGSPQDLLLYCGKGLLLPSKDKILVSLVSLLWNNCCAGIGCPASLRLRRSASRPDGGTGWRSTVFSLVFSSSLLVTLS